MSRAAEAAAVQRQALGPDVSVWVSASAGTGKTKVLTDRLLALMLDGTDPARILCLTFTRAAAAEMANRVNNRLAAWATLSSRSMVPSSVMPSQRSSAGRLNPCSTSVTRMTENVRKMMRFRCAKGRPSPSVSGSEMAAASATTPRMPVQPITKMPFASGAGYHQLHELDLLRAHRNYSEVRDQSF